MLKNQRVGELPFFIFFEKIIPLYFNFKEGFKFLKAWVIKKNDLKIFQII